MSFIKLSNIKLDIESTNDDAIKFALKKCGLGFDNVKNEKVIKRSIDARHKPDIKYVYTIGFETDCKVKCKDNILVLDKEPKYFYEVIGDKPLSEKPVVVGFGPAGIFASYLLAINGYKPIIIEQGKSIDERKTQVEKFWQDNELDISSNVQFGEGGAGTFSDGKLNTGNKDKKHRIRFILETLVKFGAPKDILYDAKPHIGTDYLTTVIKNIREHIKDNGGQFFFDTKMIDVESVNNQTEIKLNHPIEIDGNETDTLNTDCLVIAVGNGARDTFEMLYDKGFEMESKPFAVGVRVMHPQEIIDRSQYGGTYSKLGPAPYKLTYHAKSGRGVYTFCMCPGGYVVNASSEEERLVVNGMSYRERDGVNANSAIIVTVTPEDFEDDSPLAGIDFQRKLEQKAYVVGNGLIPIQKYSDFKNNIKTEELGEIIPATRGGYKLSNLKEVFPDYIAEGIIEGMEFFGQKIIGFDLDDVLMAGVESRTSSPVRIIRNENFETNFAGIYPCGEGAGYAGGIVSSAEDGMRIFEQIASVYAPLA